MTSTTSTRKYSTSATDKGYPHTSITLAVHSRYERHSSGGTTVVISTGTFVVGERLKKLKSVLLTSIASAAGAAIYSYSHFFNPHFFLPVQIVGGVSLSAILGNKPWSQVSFLFLPGTCLHFHRAWGSALPLLIDSNKKFCYLMFLLKCCTYQRVANTNEATGCCGGQKCGGRK